jgi:hypothetical protein
MRLLCQQCGCDVDVADLAQAAALTGIARPEFRACAEANQWHLFQSPDGRELVCLGSLLRSI